MTRSKEITLTIRKFGYGTVLLDTLLLTTVTLVNSQEDKKIETIDATAGNQHAVGQERQVKVIITKFSTEEDRAVLVEGRTFVSPSHRRASPIFSTCRKRQLRS
jgi:hypothetical protein